MRRLMVFVISLVFWCLLVWPYGGAAGGWDWQSVFVGLVVALAAALIFGGTLADRPAYFLDPARWFWLLCYIPVFTYACIKANLQVVYLVLHPDMPIKPGIVKVKTKLRSPTALAALANSITLTPGTLTVDANEQGELYVHWIYVESEDEKEATELIVHRFEGLLGRMIE